MTASVPTPLRRLAAAAVLAALSSGCSWLTSWAIGTDNSAPPAELVSIANPISIQRVWDVSIGDGAGKAFVRLQPAFDGDALYAAARDGDVAAIDAATGNKRWTRDTDLAISGGVGAGAGIVVVGSSKGEIVALRQADGAVAWKAQVSSEVLAPPRIGEGIVLVRVADGRFFAFDAASGRQLLAMQGAAIAPARVLALLDAREDVREARVALGFVGRDTLRPPGARWQWGRHGSLHPPPWADRLPV